MAEPSKPAHPEVVSFEALLERLADPDSDAARPAPIVWDVQGNGIHRIAIAQQARPAQITVTVGSSQGGSGKSTTSLLLANVIAQSVRRSAPVPNGKSWHNPPSRSAPYVWGGGRREFRSSWLAGTWTASCSCTLICRNLALATSLNTDRVGVLRWLAADEGTHGASPEQIQRLGAVLALALLQ